MTASRKAVLVAAIVVLGAAIVYINLTFERATGPEVEVEAVERRYLEAIVSAPGTIVPQLTVDISANTMGQVTRLEFDEGQRVAVGDFLLEIDLRPCARPSTGARRRFRRRARPSGRPRSRCRRRGST